jgi:hypothetical protein
VNQGRYVPCCLVLPCLFFEASGVKPPREHSRFNPAVAFLRSSPFPMRDVMDDRGRPRSVDARSDSIDI